MSTIVALSDFRGEIVIANKSDMAVNEGITWFINKYEPVYLRELLGSDFAALFVAGLAADPVDARWTNLLTPNGYDLKTAIANFIYYWYQRDAEIQTVGVGAAKSKAQNATVVSAAGKVARAWFEMVCTSWQTLRFLKCNPTIYPEFVVPRWFNFFFLSWETWSFSMDIFRTETYFGFYRRQRIPDVFINMNQYGI